MFEVGFSELLLISVIALVVLGPERLPKLVGQVGRWVGKARSMARQFREQLESEVNLEELTKTPPRPAPSYPPPGEAPPNEPSMSDSLSTAHMTADEPPPATSDTYSHAHPTSDAEAPSPVSTYHPEGDVYGGTEVATPELVTPEESASVAVAPAGKEEPVPAHDARV
jgi:sec-independent protein translocase protein TatB